MRGTAPVYRNAQRPERVSAFCSRRRNFLYVSGKAGCAVKRGVLALCFASAISMLGVQTAPPDRGVKPSDTSNPGQSPQQNSTPQVIAPEHPDEALKGVVPPKLLHYATPKYTREARRKRIEGTCIVSFVVGTNGRPQNIQIKQSIGYGLDKKAIEAVRKCRFKPATRDGKPVAVAIQVVTQFRIL